MAVLEPLKVTILNFEKVLSLSSFCDVKKYCQTDVQNNSIFM